MVVIIDYGLGNLRSIQFKLKKLHVNSIISSSEDEINKAEKLILPGVGHFAQGMQNLESRGLIPLLSRKVLEDKTPILGICLGMQLFTKFSEEGSVNGLGWIDARTEKFNFNKSKDKLSVPHVGWNRINMKKEHSSLVTTGKDQKFYFTHSYYVSSQDENNVIATTGYGIEFVSVIGQENILGTQFHPEKSHKEGFEIIRNFSEN